MTKPRSTRTWIGLLAIGQVASLLALWGGGPAVTPAHAQGIPDAGAQQERIINELKSVNDRLDRLITMLGEGKLQVTLRKTDDTGRNR